ncbi:deazaflavin-dependent oxidoreductase (nitroreductase family) [Sediminihabitans luteus]|uniref:Deazaflavin-dependent oxidoreductase (Nitroreductase family) n=1 Tax=Sediminihabitans luteus TaxID=1138585 RepID=A0A2M9CBW2_9CELL|nr:nitroreductase family deazaflavin-dependent oxidoreductase [Sediminihabitans luteus]PJJ68545.1 deazaflavin-dependent oxidoreductase (nitroreductase family) [Sediminihabitans luteus]GII99880.1 hypothetical protein Slu03_22580 [Sediminihabitans luteus]
MTVPRTTRPTPLTDRVLRTRWIVRAPIGLYRAGLGFLLGTRMLLVEHKGRTSGVWRQVVLEKVADGVDDDARPVIHVAAGLGPRSQWYRNLLADPRALVSTGFERRRRALAAALSPADGAAVLASYERDHPRAWARLADVLRAHAEPLADEGQDWRERVPVVRLTLLPPTT